ncbi:MAG: helix-turn-helix domain-containing protein [Oscillospiraceae bacterium]|nr:helix-turn-helix domain-containing protein [Oscillospiraceae bacterium]
MKFHEKLYLLRREKSLSQEGLADLLHVSRQAISKWESGSTYPETEKLIAISEIFGVTVDSLVKDGPLQYRHETASPFPFPHRAGFTYEYKSKRTLFGLPLVHIRFGPGAKAARGIVAIGLISQGIFSFGLLSMGLFSVGLLSLGLIGLGTFALGLLFALGGIAVGALALGGIAIGAVALGGLAIGMFATGGLAVASHVAIGDHAYGHIAVGRVAEGVRVFIDTSPAQNFLAIDGAEVREAIREEFPGVWDWVVRWITFPLR